MFLSPLGLFHLHEAERPPIFIDGFDLASVSPPAFTPKRVDVLGRSAPPLLLNALPSPASVLSGAAPPHFGLLRLRDPKHFCRGNLHHFAHHWDSLMHDILGYDVVQPWIRDQVHVPSFFQQLKGEFNGRVFDSAIPLLCTFKMTESGVWSSRTSSLKQFCIAFMREHEVVGPGRH